jgi:hypothetical protein
MRYCSYSAFLIQVSLCIGSQTEVFSSKRADVCVYADEGGEDSTDPPITTIMIMMIMLIIILL